MKHVNMKMVLGLAVSMLFIIGLAAPVSALQTNIKIEIYNEAYASGANNHTYIYFEPDPLNMVSRSTMHLNEDLNYLAYRYDYPGWSVGSGAFSDGTNPPFYWMSSYGWGTGPFADPIRLPTFFDYEAGDGSEHAVNTTMETRTFGLTFGQHTAVPVDAGYTYFGTLQISGQEFVHLTVDCRQDAVTWDVTVYDPEGRHITSYSDTTNAGNIWTIPFKPSTSGTYYVILEASPSSGTFALFDLMPVGVTPQTIGPENIITGELSTGELVIAGETDSWVHEEMAPTTHTYKVNSRDAAASLVYAFNYPENWILTTSQPVSIMFTSGEFYHYYDGGIRYSDGVSSPVTGEYFFRGGPYYVTVIGGDNTGYTLYHKSNNMGALPLNDEFQFENYMGATVTHAYTLDVEVPSILRVNSTETGADLSISLTGNLEDGYRYERSLDFDTNIQDSDEYILPVGEYLVELVLADGVNEWVEFNMGPFVEDTTTAIVDVGGFIVDTDVFQMYNMTFFLNNHDNITVDFEVTLYDESGNPIYIDTMTLANWWDGSQLIPHDTYWDNHTFANNGRVYYETFAYLALCPYQVSNNTQGATNDYMDYPVNITLQWQNHLNDYFVDIEGLDVSAGTASHNFTLEASAGGTEYYGLLANTTPGVWYNVTVTTSDVTGFSIPIRSHYDRRVYLIPWSAISSTTYSGVIAEFTFQFGAISDSTFMDFFISRTGAEGHIWVQLEPMETQQLLVEEVTPLGPDILAMLGGVAIPAAVGVGAIVVVYIVYVKKIKK